MTAWTALHESLRQLRFPTEFRIAAPDGIRPSAPAPSDRPVPVATPGDRPSDGVLPDHARADEGLSDDVLCDIATNLWRAVRRLSATAERAEVPPEQRQALRRLHAATDRLADAGIVVRCYEGMPFEHGYDLDVIAYEKSADVVRETVAETIRPGVYRGDRRIQQGQVIVAAPAEEPPAAAPPAPATPAPATTGSAATAHATHAADPAAAAPQSTDASFQLSAEDPAKDGDHEPRNH